MHTSSCSGSMEREATALAVMPAGPFRRAGGDHRTRTEMRDCLSECGGEPSGCASSICTRPLPMIKSELFVGVHSDIAVVN